MLLQTVVFNSGNLAFLPNSFIGNAVSPPPLEMWIVHISLPILSSLLLLVCLSAMCWINCKLARSFVAKCGEKWN